MNRKYILIISAAVLLGILLVVLLSRNTQPSFDGRISLSRHSKAPYGAHVAYDMLSFEFPKATISVNTTSILQWDSSQYNAGKQALIILDNYFDPSEEDLDYLTGFIQKGNKVIISALEMNSAAQQFFQVEQVPIYSDNDFYQYMTLNISHDFSTMFDTTFFHGDTAIYSFPGANYANRFDSLNYNFAYGLALNADSSWNMVGMDSHSGSFYIHAAPIAFTNFFLLYRNNYRYYQQLLSLIPPDTRKIYWDEYFIRNKASSKKQDDSKGLLTTFLANEPFAWAFWSSLVLLTLYLLTSARRKQRELPVHAPPVNDSLDFVKTVGNLYFEKGDNKDLVNKLTAIFLEQLRSRYMLSTSLLNEDFEKQLSQRSGIPLKEVSDVIGRVNAIQQEHAVTNTALAAFYSMINQFLKKI